MLIPNKRGIALLVLLLLIPSVFALIFPKETLFFDRLSPYDEQVKIIMNPEVRFLQIGVTTNTDVTRAKVTVQAMPDCPENAPYQTNVLQCFFITTQNLDEGEIAQTKISFKVPKDWLEANNFDKRKLELRRYSYSWNENNHGILSQWRTAKTTFENEDDKYAYYEATTDGFSYFSIVGFEKTEEPIVQNEVTAQTIQENPQQQSRVETPRFVPIAKDTTAQQDETKNKSTAWPYVLIFILLGSMLSLLPFATPKKEPQSPFEQLTNYIRSSKLSRPELKEKLRNTGWEDWQIELASKEAKKKD